MRQSAVASIVDRPSWRSAGFSLGVALLTIASACESPTELQRRVSVTLFASATSAVPGDTVRLLGVAHNPTGESFFMSRGCGPGIGFVVSNPEGVTRHLYDGLIFTCPLGDIHILDPHETDSISWLWRAPSSTGLYQVRASVDFHEGAPALSEPISIVVH